jgi:hypothetical protein
MHEAKVSDGVVSCCGLSAHEHVVVDYDRRVNLKRWAERQGVSYATARGWFESGELPVPARRAGRLVLVGDTESRGTPGVTAVYARVSSVGQEADLDRQVAWAAGRPGKGSPWAAS